MINTGIETYAVVVRELEREPRPMPKLPPLEAGASLKVGWGHGDPHETRRSTRWAGVDLSSSEIALCTFGVLMLLGAGLLAWVVTTFEPVQQIHWGRPLMLALGVVFALGGLLALLGSWKQWLAFSAAEAWKRDYPWREVVHHENGYGHQQGVGAWIKAVLILPVLAGIVIWINATVFFAPGMWAGWRNVFGLPLEWFGAPAGWDVAVIANFLALAVIGAMVYTAVQRLRFGRLRFRLLTFPARTGGPLRVELNFSRGVWAIGPVECTLHCVDANRMPESSSDQVPVGTPVSLYRERLQLDTAGRRVRQLRVDFQIPRDAPATAIRSQPRIYWLLSFRIPARGPDYRGDFLVPVYAEVAP